MFESEEDRLNRISGGIYNKKTYLVRARVELFCPKSVISEGKDSWREFMRDNREEIESEWGDLEEVDEGWDNCIPRNYRYVFEVSAEIEAEDEDEAERIAQDTNGFHTTVFIESIEEV